MTDGRRKRARKTPRPAASAAPPRGEVAFEMLASLARRTNELFVQLATLDARLDRLEQALWRVREECAKLVQRKPRRTEGDRRSARAATRARGNPELRLLAA
jgi:hypothetical protein